MKFSVASSNYMRSPSQLSTPVYSQLNFGIYTATILELEKWGELRGQGKSRWANINIYLTWWFFVVLKNMLQWLTLLNPT